MCGTSTYISYSLEVEHDLNCGIDSGYFGGRKLMPNSATGNSTAKDEPRKGLHRLRAPLDGLLRTKMSGGPTEMSVLASAK
jgi:hypothetical protein